MEESTTSLLNSIVAMIISITALIYTVKSYLLKSGQKIRCSYSTSSSIECDDNYISRITLENLKDKAVVIFSIYLKIGENYYLELEDFENSPLILKPFEAYQKNFDAVICYSVSMKRISVNSLLKDNSVKKRMILSTSNGKYEVSTNIKRWDPISDFFKNHMTAVININRLFHKGKSYGSNVKYLLEFKFEDEIEQVIPIRNGDERLKIFTNFQLTKDSLESKEKLLKFIELQKTKGNIKYLQVEVHDFQEACRNIFKQYDNEIIEANYYGKFKYKILGRLFTVIDNYKLKYQNRKRNQIKK